MLTWINCQSEWLPVRASGFMSIVMAGCFNLYVNPLPTHAPIHAAWHTGRYLWRCSPHPMVSLGEVIAVTEAWLLTCLFPLFKADNRFASVQGGVTRYCSVCNRVFISCARTLPYMEFINVSHDIIISFCTTSICCLFPSVHAAKPGYGLWRLTSQHTPLFACAIFALFTSTHYHLII